METACNHLTKFISPKIGLVNIRDTLPSFDGPQMGRERKCSVLPVGGEGRDTFARSVVQSTPRTYEWLTYILSTLMLICWLFFFKLTA